MITICVQYPTNVHVVGTTDDVLVASEVVTQLSDYGWDVWVTHD